jgi:hypothetical protein
MEEPPFEGVLCWICDYSLVVLAVLIVLIFAVLRLPMLDILAFTPDPTPTNSRITTPEPTDAPQSTPSLEPSPSPTSLITPSPSPTSAPSPTPTPERPVFVITYIPMDWQGSLEEFFALASAHHNFFLAESDIENFFIVEVVFLDSIWTDGDLSSEELVYDLVEYGASQSPADRYVGLTDGNVTLAGSDVTGWAMGGQPGVVVEASGVSITAHELGHTFGLCDEYNYAVWLLQNEDLTNGCPNPYPEDCEADPESTVVDCLGAPAPDGSNSIMGPSGMPGAYSYNTACYDHLQKVFEDIANLYWGNAQ